MEDRLERIRRLLKERRAYWSAYNPSSSFLYDVEDAGDDIQWLLAEVTRLREEAKDSATPRTPDP
ncbi:MAG: hypothetical protein A2177_12600 [Spirochaetes bacterium RBG_13_68_11]|nr:MAG: hypothetical protein A2177_12600 [Spirochaetes bacterium RBG_13_68_11]